MSKKHKVSQGECIESLADRYGFFPETLWKHSENQDLRKLRDDQNILQPGDVVMIPDLEMREESAATEKLHKFRRKGVPAKLRIVFYKPVDPEDQEDDGGSESDSGGSGGGFPAGPTQDRSDESVYEEEPEELVEEREPIADAPYRLDLAGSSTDGQSDGDGLVEVPIPLGERTGTITFYPDSEEPIKFDLDLGEMDSIETVVGARKRLCNMGYRCLAEGDELDGDLRGALLRFQDEYDLETSGELDGPTKDKLVEVNGS